ncbi:MAG: hypothetical protein HQ541_03090 [Mariniphaga sp.]|nr:hypothetical protein [Mariniphaga sp.]
MKKTTQTIRTIQHLALEKHIKSSRKDDLLFYGKIKNKLPLGTRKNIEKFSGNVVMILKTATKKNFIVFQNDLKGFVVANDVKENIFEWIMKEKDYFFYQKLELLD